MHIREYCRTFAAIMEKKDIKKVAIFDLDGTLLNTIDDLGMACNHALSRFGYPIHSAEEYPHLVGNGVNRLIMRALPETEKTEENVLRLREVFIPYYNSHNKVHTRPYNGIEKVLEEMKSKGWLLAVASNKYQAATEDLIRHYFPNIFDIVLGEREGRPRKPDPQIVHDIIGSRKLTTVIYIGDSDVDMQTALNAGVPAVACTWGFCTRETLLQYNPQYIIDNPKHILTIIQNI